MCMRVRVCQTRMTDRENNTAFGAFTAQSKHVQFGLCMSILSILMTELLGILAERLEITCDVMTSPSAAEHSVGDITTL